MLIFLALATIAYSQDIKKQHHYRLTKSFYADLNNDGKTDTITINLLPQNQTFTTISIKLAGLPAQSFYAKEYWTMVDKWFLDSNKNAVNTKLFFLKKTNKHSVILLFGESYGSGERGEFSIINIEDNKAKMVFDHDDDIIDVELPLKLIDLNNDGRLDFIYRNLGEYDEVLNKGKVGVYHPFYIYPVYDDSCKLSKQLTKEYNLKNYVFAGYKCNERIRVYYPDNGGKPRILKRKRPEE